jgi:hypothetical protein
VGGEGEALREGIMTEVTRMEIIGYVVLALFVGYILFTLNVFRREK